MSQIALYELYSDRLRTLEDGDPLQDALADALDCIWAGGWGQGRDLFPEALTDQRLVAAKKRFR